jgi:iron complex transport system substrate-binding protein
MLVTLGLEGAPPGAAACPFRAAGADLPPASAGLASQRMSAQVQEFRDCLGHEITWAQTPGRIVSLSPNLTEILYAIGAGEAVVGVTRFCDYPTAAQSVRKVGGIVDPSLEILVSLAPDLVLVTRGVPLEAMSSIRALGIPLFALDSRGGLDAIHANILELGKITGRAAPAEEVAREFERRWKRVLMRTLALPREARPRVFHGDLDGAHWTAGPGTYVHDLIEAAGGRNVAANAPGGWVPLALEAIVAADPEVYLGTYDEEEESVEQAAERVRRSFRELPGWPHTTLGRSAQPRVFLVEVDQLQRPGPRIVGTLEAFSRFLHPLLWAAAPEGEPRQ